MSIRSILTKSTYFTRSTSIRLAPTFSNSASFQYLRPVTSLRYYSENTVGGFMAKEGPSPEDNMKASDNSRSAEEHPSSHQASDSTEGKHEWKTRPPYSIHKDNEKFDAIYEASCHCGKVQYQLSRDEPLDSKLCHCTTCQTQHAAPFQWAAIFKKTDINFTQGHHNLEWYDPSTKSIEHNLPCKVRCNYCHSPIFDEGRNMILLFPSLVHLKTKEAKHKFKPRCHMFYGQRVIDIPDGLPKWTGLNNESDLIEDSPPDLVKENNRKQEKKREEKKKKEEEEEKKKEGKDDDKKDDSK